MDIVLKNKTKIQTEGGEENALYFKKITEFERNTCCGFILRYMSSIHAKMEERNKTK